MISNNSCLVRHEVEMSNDEKNKCRETYGDKMIKKKSSKTIRVVFQNVNGFLPVNGDDKKELIRNFINDNRVDIFMMAEVNVNWKIVGVKENLRSLTRKWFRNSRVAVAHNLLSGSKTPHQPGGVSTIVAGDLSASVIKSHNDKRMMGRWTSTTIRGRLNKITRVVTVYVPCNSRTHGCKAVFSQQQAALLKSNIGKGVLKRFWMDFWSEVEEWRANGESLIIAGDWNRNIYDKNMQKN